MTTSSLVKWCHLAPAISVCGGRWYLRSAVSYRDGEALLYRAVDSEGHTIDCLLSATLGTQAAERVYRKALRAQQTATPRVITVEKHAASPPAFEALQQTAYLPDSCTLRPWKYFNNMVDQDHRLVKRHVNPGLGFGSFRTAQRSLRG
jgi:transposase, IS6 family